MAKAWRNRSGTVQLKGFDDFLEKLQTAGASLEKEGEKCFKECTTVLYDELRTQAQNAGLAPRLVGKIREEAIMKSGANIWYYEVGWKKQKPTKSSPLPDTYKVMFYNYGTPSERFTKSGASRGKESDHPKGSHGFIKKAKLAAASKAKKIQKETLKKIIGDLQ